MIDTRDDQIGTPGQHTGDGNMNTVGRGTRRIGETVSALIDGNGTFESQGIGSARAIAVWCDDSDFRNG